MSIIDNVRRKEDVKDDEKEKDRWLKFYLAGLATLDTVIAILTLIFK